jgi:hypothetical protein
LVWLFVLLVLFSQVEISEGTEVVFLASLETNLLCRSNFLMFRPAMHEWSNFEYFQHWKFNKNIKIKIFRGNWVCVLGTIGKLFVEC